MQGPRALSVELVWIITWIYFGLAPNNFKREKTKTFFQFSRLMTSIRNLHCSSSYRTFYKNFGALIFLFFHHDAWFNVTRKNYIKQASWAQNKTMSDGSACRGAIWTENRSSRDTKHTKVEREKRRGRKEGDKQKDYCKWGCVRHCSASRSY